MSPGKLASLFHSHRWQLLHESSRCHAYCISRTGVNVLSRFEFTRRFLFWPVSILWLIREFVWIPRCNFVFSGHSVSLACFRWRWSSTTKVWRMCLRLVLLRRSCLTAQDFSNSTCWEMPLLLSSDLRWRTSRLVVSSVYWLAFFFCRSPFRTWSSDCSEEGAFRKETIQKGGGDRNVILSECRRTANNRWNILCELVCALERYMTVWCAHIVCFLIVRYLLETRRMFLCLTSRPTKQHVGAKTKSLIASHLSLLDACESTLTGSAHLRKKRAHKQRNAGMWAWGILEQTNSDASSEHQEPSRWIQVTFISSIHDQFLLGFRSRVDFLQQSRRLKAEIFRAFDWGEQQFFGLVKRQFSRNCCDLLQRPLSESQAQQEHSPRWRRVVRWRWTSLAELRTYLRGCVVFGLLIQNPGGIGPVNKLHKCWSWVMWEFIQTRSKSSTRINQFVVWGDHFVVTFVTETFHWQTLMFLPVGWRGQGQRGRGSMSRRYEED